MTGAFDSDAFFTDAFDLDAFDFGASGGLALLFRQNYD